MSDTTYLPQNSKRAGFTLVEMLVIAPIVILLIGTIIYAIVQLTGEALAERSSAQLMGNVQSALNRIEEDTKISGAYLATNNVPLTSPQGYDNGTQNFASVSGNGNMLILNTFATTANPNNPSRSLVYLANMPNACGSTNLPQNQVMTVNTVYFTKLNTTTNSTELWRRTLAIDGYLTKDCITPAPWQRPSCAPGMTGTMCVTQDEKLLSGISEFTIEYFNVASDTSPSSGAQNANATTRQSALDLASTIQVTIKATINGAGRDIEQQGTVRATRVGSMIKYATP